MDPVPLADTRHVQFADRLPPGSLTWVSPALEVAVEDRLVKAAFAYLVTNGVLGPTRARELGRALGREAREGRLPVHLEAFSHLGLGALRLVSGDEARYVFAGRDLVASEAAANAVACALALGYAEGLVQGLTGRRTLGSEMTCRSRGHPECTFVVQARK